MKLLINEDMIYTISCEKMSSQEKLYNYDHFIYINNILEKFSIYHKNSLNNNEMFINICAQKITIDQYDMNEFFSEVINQFFETELKYVELGSKGCDFCIKISQFKLINKKD